MSNAPQKIIHIITTLDVGGSEMMLYRLLKHIDRIRFENRVISLVPPGAVGEMIMDMEIPVESLYMERGRPTIHALYKLVEILKESQLDILQSWLYHADLLGLVAGKLAGVSNILWNVRSSNMDMTQYGPLSGLVVRVCALLSRFPQGVVINSNAGKHYHTKIGYRPRRWEFIPNGIDIEYFQQNLSARRTMRAEWDIADDVILIGYVARFDPMKDHITFLEAAKRLVSHYPRVVFVLCGDGIDWDNSSLVTVIKSLNLHANVRLLGSRSDMARVYSTFDIVASSSLSEGFPNTLAEAMACGVPVVATDAGDSALIVGKTGLIVPPRSPQELADGWKYMLSIGEASRLELGEQARQRIENRFCLDKMITNFEELYGQLSAV